MSLSAAVTCIVLTVVQTQHVDSMQADMGGTEMQAALEHMFRSRQHIVPTACFLLTDGEVSLLFV